MQFEVAVAEAEAEAEAVALTESEDGVGHANVLLVGFQGGGRCCGGGSSSSTSRGFLWLNYEIGSLHSGSRMSVCVSVGVWVWVLWPRMPANVSCVSVACGCGLLPPLFLPESLSPKTLKIYIRKKDRHRRIWEEIRRS